MNASGSRARTFSPRFDSQGVREEVAVDGGEGEVVVSRMWTASLSYLPMSYVDIMQDGD